MNPWEEYAGPESGPWADYVEPAPAISEAPMSPVGGTLDNLRAGSGRAFNQIGLGLKGAIDLAALGLSKIPGVGSAVDAAGAAFGMPSAQQAADATTAQVEEAKRLDAPLLATGAGAFGSGATQIGLALPLLAVPGANTAVGAPLVGAVQGALMQPGSLEDRAKAGGMGAVGGAAGHAIGAGLGKAGQVVSERVAARMSPQVAQTAANARVAQQAGYVLPPVTTNPTIFNRLMEGFAGKLTTAQQASMRNQEVTNRLARESLGLNEGTQITPEVLRSVRQEAGKAYQALEEIPITADVKYGKALQELTSRQSKAAAAFPGAGPDPLAAQVQSLWAPEFTGGQALAKISLLREQAKAAYRTDPSLARGLNGAADALEDVMDRNLQGMGSRELLDNYRTARAQIARAHTVERALNPSTLNVSARELGKQVAKGKPLSGGLEVAGRTGLAFPKATADIAESMPGVSPLDFTVAAGSTLAGAPAGSLGWLLGRPLTRNALLSSPYQAAFVPPGGLTQAGAQALQSPVIPNALGFLGANAAIQE